MKKPTFDIKDVIYIVGIVTTTLGMYYGLSGRLDIVEEKVKPLEKYNLGLMEYKINDTNEKVSEIHTIITK